MRRFTDAVKQNSNNVLLLAIVFSLGLSFIFETAFLVSDLYHCITGAEGYSWSDENYYIIESAVLAAVMVTVAASAMMACTKSRKWIGLTAVLLVGLVIYSMDVGVLNCLILAIIWSKNAKQDLSPDDNKLLKTAVILAVISFASVLALPLYGMLMLVVGSNSFTSAWMMFVFGSQLLTFILKPEIIVMIYLFRKSSEKRQSIEEPLRHKVKTATTVYFVLWVLLAAMMLMADLTQNGVLSQWFGAEAAGVEAGDWSEWETESDFE